jgi:hypothetical protein
MIAGSCVECVCVAESDIKIFVDDIGFRRDAFAPLRSFIKITANIKITAKKITVKKITAKLRLLIYVTLQASVSRAYFSARYGF